MSRVVKYIRSACLFVALFLGASCYAQSVVTTFYKDRYLRNEVSASKGKFSRTVSNEADGRMVTEVKDLKRNEVLMREIYKGLEPFGVWFYDNGENDIFLDYEFEMVYSDKKFEENELSKKLIDFFQDNDSLGYTAPVITTGEKTMARFVTNNLFFPVKAREEAIQGRVYVGFTVTESGSVEDFMVYKYPGKEGVSESILLDKEAVRTMRKLKLSSPAKVKGEAKAFKLMLPILFLIK
jgi:TonB family protein